MGSARALCLHRRRGGAPRLHRARRDVTAPVLPEAQQAHAAAERAARQSYGRLVAILSARTRDIAASEDALAEAFARALERWPAEGIPRQPEAWLLSVARNRVLDAWRHSRVQDD